jgi:membrane-associated phospholipid phosphatase
MRDLFYKLPKNILRCFQGYNILWHLLAIFLTYIIVSSGFDWLYFTSTRITLLQSLLFPAVAFGGLLPILVPLIMFIVGRVKKTFQIVNTAFALGQSAILGLLISGFYKAFTGRVHPPEIFARGSFVDISHQFRFGFWRGGVFWGWPSTHTTIAFAMVLTLIYLYPKNKVVKYLALIYAFYVGFGVSISIHWLSDFIAGAIIGSVIGIVVGKSFLERYLLNTNKLKISS